MNPYNCNWNVPTKLKPDLRMYSKNPIRDSSVEWIYNCNLSNENEYVGYQPIDKKIIQIKKEQCKNGGRSNNGFFGEVKGSCGWKPRRTGDCCFSKCSSAWKTRLYPFNLYL